MNFENFSNNDVIFISKEDDEDFVNMDYLMSEIETKRGMTVSIVDAENPEDSQLYTYNKFLEIFDNSGLDGFIV